MFKGNCVCFYVECRVLFFCDGFGYVDDICFGECIVDLIGVFVDIRGGIDVDDVFWFVVFYMEVRGCFVDDFEGDGIVQGYDGVLLFVGYLFMLLVLFIWGEEGERYFVKNCILGKISIIYNDVDFFIFKFGCFSY